MNQNELDRYEARLKWERDNRAVQNEVKNAIARAYAKGFVMGQKEVYIKEIHFYQKFLTLPLTAADELERLPLENLSQQLDEMRTLVLRSRS